MLTGPCPCQDPAFPWGQPVLRWGGGGELGRQPHPGQSLPRVSRPGSVCSSLSRLNAHGEEERAWRLGRAGRRALSVWGALGTPNQRRAPMWRFPTGPAGLVQAPGQASSLYLQGPRLCSIPGLPRQRTSSVQVTSQRVFAGHVGGTVPGHTLMQVRDCDWAGCPLPATPPRPHSLGAPGWGGWGSPQALPLVAQGCICCFVTACSAAPATGPPSPWT